MTIPPAATAASTSAEAAYFAPAPLPEDGAAGALLAYWRGKRGARPMPARADIRPAEMRAHLPNLVLLDVVDKAADFYIRLFGSHLVETYGIELTGRRVSMLQPETAAAKWLKLARACVADAVPVFGRTRIATDDRFHLVYDALLLPLSADGAAVTQVLGHLMFLANASDAPDRWIPTALRPVFADMPSAPDMREKRPPLPRERRFLMRTRPG
jgi:hypothetical protein